MLISIIIPAFNEENYLAGTLGSLSRAQARLESETEVGAEIIVVDNASTDATVPIATDLQARVITEAEHNVARVRNRGAQSARGDVLIFIDADTIVPDALLVRIAAEMSNTSCLGGAVDTDHRPTKIMIQIYLQFWRVLGKMFGLAQGATQFCRRDVFSELNGYDQDLYMGEDVDFFQRLKRLATSRAGSVAVINDLKVVPSARRFDRWSVWRTLIWTNPLLILLCQRHKAFWDGWYKTAPR